MGTFFELSFSVICVTLPSGVVIFAAANFFYSAVPLHRDMALQMVKTVSDWLTVKHALDLGCDHWILLNAVATQLKKEGSSGRVVGLDPNKMAMLKTLRTVKIEGVGEYVTCKEGDVRSLLFGDNYFDVVVSEVFVHTVGFSFFIKMHTWIFLIFAYLILYYYFSYMCTNNVKRLPRMHFPFVN